MVCMNSNKKVQRSLNHAELMMKILNAGKEKKVLM